MLVETPAAPNKNSLYPKNLSLGMHVKVTSEKDIKLLGVIRFIGHTSFASGIWIGVELFAPLGKNDGTVNGQNYFSCKPSYGIFVREMHIEIPQMTLDMMAAEATKENHALQTKDAATAAGNAGGAKSAAALKETEAAAESRVMPLIDADHDRPLGDIPHGITAQTDGTDGLSLDTSITAATGQSLDGGERQHIDTLNGKPSPEQAQQLQQHKQPEQQQSYEHGNCVLQTGAANSAMHCAKVHDILKLKLSQMMETLNQQIEILNDLDREELNRRAGKLNVQRITDLHSEVLELTLQEADLIAAFKKRYVNLLEAAGADPSM